MLVTAVPSTRLATVAYDSANRVLWLEFRSRAVYLYFNVPAKVHRNLLTAPSKGTYFNRYIRGRFALRKLPEGALTHTPAFTELEHPAAADLT